MRIVALALTVPPLIAALLVAGLIATAMPASQASAERGHIEFAQKRAH